MANVGLKYKNKKILQIYNLRQAEKDSLSKSPT